MLPTSEFKARPLNPEKDLNFILSTWLQSYRNSEFAHSIEKEVYYKQHQMIIAQVLKHPTNSVTIICDKEDEDQILGYICYSTDAPIIYFAYVKHPFRKLGLGRYMFEGVKTHIRDMTEKDDPVITCTHKCRRWRRVAKKLNLTYNPYVIGA